MARVTVEDCVLKVPNRFELVALAAQRARDISAGNPLTVDRDRDKNPVVALREIADGTINIDDLREALVHSLQKHVEADQAEEETESFELETFVPELAGVGEPAPEPAGADEADEEIEGEETDFESFAREVQAEVGALGEREES